MLIPDVNILVNAARPDTVHHGVCRRWLEGALAGREVLGLTDHVATGFVRIVTHPRVFKVPSPLAAALRFLDELMATEICDPVRPGERYWTLFKEICVSAKARGNLVADVHVAAIAVEVGARVVTMDRDFQSLSRVATVLVAPAR